MNPRRGFSPWAQLPLWALGSSLAGLVIGLAVGLFSQGGIEMPILVISVLFGNVVGFTAMICAVVLFPRLRGLAPGLRLALLGLALVSGSAAGSVAVLAFYPLFIFREPRLAAAVVAINGVLAVIVGGVVYAYEGLRLRLQDTLREVDLCPPQSQNFPLSTTCEKQEPQCRHQGGVRRLGPVQLVGEPAHLGHTQDPVPGYLGEGLHTSAGVPRVLRQQPPVQSEIEHCFQQR